MEYNFREIEKKWQKYWEKHQIFKAENNSEKPKYYVLDMFPYPSGAGLHVGHPLGYIASDIYARYKRLQGFNVLHPMGYDSFGLPAEQYAIQTGQHPAITTKVNIDGGVDKSGNKIPGYEKQLKRLGLSFDWSRKYRTSDATYYKWTQWIFIQLYEHYFCNDAQKARPISELIEIFSKNGNSQVNAACDADTPIFSSEEWQNFSDEKKQEILLKYRLTYLAETEVNWCPELGTVLANDEVVNGVSERGGYPVVRKKMKQWSMRISAYAERLLQGLETVDWTEALKDTQRNWIGRSEGAMVSFEIPSQREEELRTETSLSRGNGAEQKPGYMTGGNNAALLLEKAQENRQNPTEAEAILWKELKGKSLGVKFRRQHLIDDFIVDFVCLSKMLVIEVDGGYHNKKTQQGKDQERATILENLGYKVIRFSNEEVIGNLDEVLQNIKNELTKTPLSSGKAQGDRIQVFTTRPDTIFGVSFMVLAPEHELVLQITTAEQRADVEAYIEATAKRSERDRMSDVKTISGVFTGAYAIHPFTKKQIPIWIGDYVLASYGTGAVMAVPAGDDRDYAFAKHFNIPIINIFDGIDISEQAYTDKSAETPLVNSDFLNGLTVKKAMKTVIYEMEKNGIGCGKINYRLRDAVFSRQRYWGEPFPVYYVNGLPQMLPEECLPLVLPEIDEYLPTEDGDPPLGRAKTWAWDTKQNKVVSNDLIDNETVFPLELNTMPGWAGSSWYFLRYMDANNDNEFVAQEVLNYWQNVDLYLGGSEHATGHLLYSRFWHKFLYDCGLVPTDEYAKKLINQGMILGTSALVYRLDVDFNIEYNLSDLSSNILDKNPIFTTVTQASQKGSAATKYYFSKNKKIVVSDKMKKEIEESILDNSPKAPIDNIEAVNQFDRELTSVNYKLNPLRVDVNLVGQGDVLDVEALKKWLPEYAEGEFVLEDGKYIVGREVEKMSKRWYNVVNPDDICEDYGADALRLYEMFLGPIEQSKPWNTQGLSGVSGFIRKLWRLFHNKENEFVITDEKPTKEELKVLYQTIKKVQDDMENFSFNTSVSHFMIAVNELTKLGCNKREILEPLVILVSSYAPHLAEELWGQLGHKESITFATFPKFEPKHLQDDAYNYPVSFNGKMRFKREFDLTLSREEVEAAILADKEAQKWLEGKTPKKIIFVPKKIVNIVF